MPKYSCGRTYEQYARKLSDIRPLFQALLIALNILSGHRASARSPLKVMLIRISSTFSLTMLLKESSEDCNCSAFVMSSLFSQIEKTVHSY